MKPLPYRSLNAVVLPLAALNEDLSPRYAHTSISTVKLHDCSGQASCYTARHDAVLFVG